MNLSSADVDIRLALSTPLEVMKASLARDSLSDFVRMAWQYADPAELRWNWHLDELCSVLESVSRGEIKRLIVNIPPGFSKSMLISVLWPAWEWSRNPSLSYLTASYSDENPIRDNRRLRSVVTSDWYKSHFNVQLASDQWAKIRFDTTAKGWRIATSVGGGGTGEHPDRIIIDDPIKAKGARSEVALKTCIDWFDNTISTRAAKNPAIIVVMQRLHTEDLSGHLLSIGGWEHVCFPMRYVPSRPATSADPGYVADPRDRRSTPGELLWPAEWPQSKLEPIENLLGAFGVAGQFQQRPIPEGGGLFKREWFEIVDAAPIIAQRCRGWDIAESDPLTSSTGDPDWTVGVRLSRSESGIIYVEDVVRDRRTLVDGLIKSVAITDGRACKIREGAGSGKAMIKARSILLAGYDYAASPETDSKIERANPFRAQCEAGNVKLVRGPWNEAYLSVVTSFPVGKHDDDVDASSNAFNELVGMVKKVGRMTWGRRRRS